MKTNGTCRHESCATVAALVRGLCPKHYRRLMRHGDADYVTPRPPRSAAESVAAVVDRTDENGCWIARTSVLNNQGYGMTYHGGRNVLAHRLAYELHVGPIPEGLRIDHLCRVRACCNPAHLEAVTASVNKQRAWDASRAVSA